MSARLAPQDQDSLHALATRWSALRARAPKLRARDAAAQLGVSELELLACEQHAEGVRVTWLTPRFDELLRGLPAVGRCMALTRNEHAVLEVKGRYGGVKLGPHAGQVVGEGIDLRVFLSRWRHGVAMEAPHPQRAGERRRSVLLFDASGVAVHKVFLEPEGEVAAWNSLMSSLACPAPSVLELAAASSSPTPRHDFDERARAAFCAAWEAMTDTHELFGLLREHRLTRVQALRAVWPQRAYPVEPSALGHLLGKAAEDHTAIMIFVGNPGCIQISSGPVHNVVRRGPWLNILDKGHNLHLREDHIGSAWVVHKPTRTGCISSLELYDDAGDTMAMVFRKRTEDQPAEDASWSAKLAALPRRALLELATPRATAPEVAS